MGTLAERNNAEAQSTKTLLDRLLIGTPIMFGLAIFIGGIAFGGIGIFTVAVATIPFLLAWVAAFDVNERIKRRDKINADVVRQNAEAKQQNAEMVERNSQLVDEVYAMGERMEAMISAAQESMEAGNSPPGM